MHDNIDRRKHVRISYCCSSLEFRFCLFLLVLLVFSFGNLHMHIIIMEKFWIFLFSPSCIIFSSLFLFLPPFCYYYLFRFVFRFLFESVLLLLLFSRCSAVSYFLWKNVSIRPVRLLFFCIALYILFFFAVLLLTMR